MKGMMGGGMPESAARELTEMLQSISEFGCESQHQPEALTRPRASSFFALTNLSLFCFRLRQQEPRCE